jgi:hypothetical protein
MMTGVRVVKLVILLAFGAFCAIVAAGALQNLVADYQDSPVSTYLLIGLPALALAVAAFVAAWQLLRRG